MDFVPVLVLLATVKKVVDFVAFVRDRNFQPVVTQILAWAAGVALVALAAHTSWADGIVWGDIALARMGFASQVLAGIALGSTASLAHDAVSGTPILGGGSSRSAQVR